MDMTTVDDLPPPASADVTRHILKVEEELRLEVNFSKTCDFQLTLRQGSAELYGVELALNKTYTLAADTGGMKLAIFTWHGCVVDVECRDGGSLEISYISDETNSNVAAVNTHAQLEALRDEAAASQKQGPRVLVVGPTESGKTSLAKVLTAYAVKLGRTPILVDLDPADNCLSIAGTLAACCMDQDSLSMETYATTGIPMNSHSSQQQAQPLVLWHGKTELSNDLYREQVGSLGRKIEARLEHDEWARSSGIIVNTNGWIQDDGFKLLLTTVEAFKISVVLVLGHDRLYSMMKSAVGTNDNKNSTTSATKVIKVPRSGGVVSRANDFLLNNRSRSIRRYFYGSMVDPPQQQPQQQQQTQMRSVAVHRVPQLTPFALQIRFDKLTLYKYSSLSLSASLLPVTGAQSTEPVQLERVEITEKLLHTILAVCHPQAVAAFEQSGKARDLYESGVAGFCVVERVLEGTDMIHVLSPCAGNLPSHTLLVGDITWME